MGHGPWAMATEALSETMEVQNPATAQVATSEFEFDSNKKEHR